MFGKRRSLIDPTTDTSLIENEQDTRYTNESCSKRYNQSPTDIRQKIKSYNRVSTFLFILILIKFFL